MTKGRKIGISIAFALIFILVCACIVPLYANHNANVANAVTVKTRGEWVNPYNGSYYDNLNTNQTGTAFRSDLAKLITHTNNPTYNELKEIFKTTDVDPTTNGNVIWFYTGDSIPYTGAMDSGNYPTNREHVWPKMGGSAFPETSEAGSDAHHLRPLNTGLNNTRSNYHFGEVTQSTSNRVKQTGTLANYGTDDPDTWCYLSGGYFYPAAGYRGATARILFYVQTRWGDRSSLSFTLGSGSAKVMSNIDILLKWHLQEPPTEEEIRRNEAVAKIQGNRNPFIDHPEYAEMIYCYDGKTYNSTLQNIVKTYGSYLDGNGGGGGGTVTPDPTPGTDLSTFNSCLESAYSAKTLEEKYTAIDAAIKLYQAMSSSEQSANRAVMQDVIDEYNQAIKGANEEFQAATNVASQAVAQTLSIAFLALVLVVVKQTVGR